MGRSEKLIEYGDSWFSPKCIEVQPRVNNIAGVELWMGKGAAVPTEPNQTANTAIGTRE